jgi:DNA-binding MarR family transcriptional regulator
MPSQTMQLNGDTTFTEERDNTMTKDSLGYESALSGKQLVDDEDWIIHFGFLIHDAARKRRLVLDELFKPLNITRSQAWALAYLSTADGLTQSELADKMGLGKVALGGLIDRLENGGMVERRPHPTDRRINMVHLTLSGYKVCKAMRSVVLQHNREMFEGISIDELKQTTKVLARLKDNLSKMPKSS